jgi:hypothetical protein
MGKNSLLELLTAFRQSAAVHGEPPQEKIEDLLHVQGVQGNFDLPPFHLHSRNIITMPVV